MYSANTEECTLILMYSFPNWAHTAVMTCFVSKVYIWLRNLCKCNVVMRRGIEPRTLIIKRNVEKKPLLLLCRTGYCAKKPFIGEHLMVPI